MYAESFIFDETIENHIVFIQTLKRKGEEDHMTLKGTFNIVSYRQKSPLIEVNAAETEEQAIKNHKEAVQWPI